MARALLTFPKKLTREGSLNNIFILMRFAIPGQWVITNPYAVQANNPSEGTIDVFIRFTKLPDGINFQPLSLLTTLN